MRSLRRTLLVRRRLRKFWNNLVYKILSSVLEYYCMEEEMPRLRIGGLEVESCIVQGGMGVGVSKAGLASAVANNGGVGNIATVGLGLLDELSGDYAEINAWALRGEIRKARGKTNGVIGVNIMHALSDYDSLVRASVDEDVDLIISGAGIPRDLPKYLGGKDIKLVPIVSSLKYTKLITKAWEKLEHPPDAIVVEGPLAGGHLGFKYEDLRDGTAESLEDITRQVVEFTDGLKYDVPVIAAGGIYTGADIYEALGWGAKGVQMGTRFVTTDECDASKEFKDEYLRANKEDIVLIESPVGLPGRAINNAFLRSIRDGGVDDFRCEYKCLKTCVPDKSPYCIANALVEANRGDFTRGFAFAGANAYRCDKIVPVKELMDTLREEYSVAAVADRKK